MSTPPVVVPEPDVKAFRVTDDFTFFGAIIAGAIQFGDTIDDVPIERCQVAPQYDSYFRYNTLAFPFFAHYHDRSVSVRLYRRGYETVDVEPRSYLFEFWRFTPIKVEWKKAETLEAREDALNKIGPHQRATMSVSVAAFLADEYVALAGDPRASDVDRKRLLKTAEQTRTRASKLDNLLKATDH